MDQKTYLVELLMKQDKMSMAASIESRVPFLDHNLVEFAATVPARHKLRGTNGKYLVKRAMRELLPASIVKRRKMGFPVPMRHWLKGGFHVLARSILLGSACRNRGIVDTEYVAIMLEQHKRGARDHTEALWNLLNLELWARLFIDGESPEGLSNEFLDRLSPTTSLSFSAGAST